MKRVTLITVILLFTVLTEMWGLFRLKEYTGMLSEQLLSLSSQAETSPDRTMSELLDIRSRWKKSRRAIGVFIHEKNIDIFDESLTSAILHLSEHSPQSSMQLRLAADAASRIWEHASPSPENIF